MGSGIVTPLSVAIPALLLLAKNMMQRSQKRDFSTAAHIRTLNSGRHTVRTVVARSSAHCSVRWTQQLTQKISWESSASEGKAVVQAAEEPAADKLAVASTNLSAVLCLIPWLSRRRTWCCSECLLFMPFGEDCPFSSYLGPRVRYGYTVDHAGHTQPCEQDPQ